MKDIFNELIKNQLTPNQLYILFCTKHKTVPNKFVNNSLENQRLINNNWLTEETLLTTKANVLLDSLEGYFRKSKSETNVDLMGNKYIDNIKIYVNLFPEGKLPSGKYARTNPKNLESAFRWFFKTYDYNWDTVVEATKLYLDEYERNNWKYMRTSQYFVRKQNPDKSFESDLANYCDVYLKGDYKTNNDHFSDKVV